MKNRLDINSINSLLEKSNVQFAGIFGSFAKGTNKNTSDIDILVKFTEPASLLEIINLERKISEKIGKDVDLVTENSLSPFIKEEIINSLKPIYGKR